METMRGQRVAEVVSWPVGRMRLWRRVCSLALVVGGILHGLGGAIPMEPDRLGLLRLRMPGEGGARMRIPSAWMTDPSGADGPWLVVAHVDHLRVEPAYGALPGPARIPHFSPMDLSGWAITASRYQGWARRSSTDPLARWVVEIVPRDGRPIRRTLHTRWITLAWIGRLSGWPAPPAP